MHRLPAVATRIAVAAAVLLPYASTQSTFGERTIVTGHVVDPHTVALDDLDGDGDLDVLSASSGFESADNRVVWFPNDGGTMGRAQTVGRIDHVRQVAVADVDSDGDPDVLAGGDWPTSQLSWYANDGGGKFGAPHVIHASSTEGFELADLDGDGDVDLHRYGYDEYAWHENDRGVFGAGNILLAGERPVDAATADLDGDGDPDPCGLMKFGPGGDEIVWFENDLSGSGALAGPEIVVTSFRAETFELLDLDLDGDVDILTGDVLQTDVRWYENVGGPASFGPAQVISDEVAARTLAGADLDRDGDPDVVVGTHYDGILWHRNDGGGSFAPSTTVTQEPRRVADVAFGDVDGDGTLDLVSASRQDGDIAWFRNVDGQGTFERRRRISTHAGGVRWAIPLDVDGDADLDVAGALRDEDRVVWYEHVDGGRFDPFERPVSTELVSAQFLRASDVDADGDADIVAGGLAAWWYANDGTGHFEERQVSATYHLNSIGVGDLTGDGAPDILLSHFFGLEWFENADGVGGFGPAQSIDSPWEDLYSVEVGDLDLDGDLDVVYAADNDFRVVWHPNDGLGRFGASKSILSTGNPQDVELADLDGDGDLDVIGAGDDEIRWARNNGGGSFSFGIGNEVTTQPNGITSIHAADVDGDGDVDVLSTSRYDALFQGDAIALYENVDGDGLFAGRLIDVVQNPQCVVVADMDGDGDLDPLVSSSLPQVFIYESDQIAWYPNLLVDGPDSEGPEPPR